MIRRAITLLLIGVLFLSSAGCGWFIETEPSVSDTFVPRKELISMYKNRWCYSRLDAHQKANYAAVFEAVYDSRFTVSTVHITIDGVQTVRSGVSVKLPYPLAEKQQATLLYDAFLRDHPQFFFIGNLYSVDGIGRLDRLQLTYTMDVQTRNIACDELDKTVRTFLSGMPQGDDFSKELWIHDKLLRNCQYDDTQAEKDSVSSGDAFTAYGALINGKAVCEGYSRAILLLLQSAGMHGTVVTGTDMQGGAHMWNVVNVNGRNYHLDATWNDTDWGIRHTYFNLSTQEIQIDHRFETEDNWVDTCLAFQDGYHTRKGTLITSYDLESIVRATVQQVCDGETVIELQFSQSVFNNGKFFVQNREWFTETVDAALAHQQLYLPPYELLSDGAHYVLILRLKTT